MNYYILPKNNNEPSIDGIFAEENISLPYISHSVVNYLNKSNYNFEKICMISNSCDIKELEIINKMTNTYEFIFSNVPNSLLSVSKIKTESNLFYELTEIFFTCNLHDFFETKNRLNTYHFTEYFNSSIQLLDTIRENLADLNIGSAFGINEIKNFNASPKSLLKFDYMFFEFKKEDYKNNDIYFKNMIMVLKIILHNQNFNGISIIRVDEIIHKVLIDILFILSTLFEKIYIIKPQVSNVKTNERFIVCKNFEMLYDLENIKKNINEVVMSLFDVNSTNKIVSSLMSDPISCYFINKIEESNIIIGQQQLEAYDQIINIIKNKNKEDKIETLKRNNIQKCILWCEKYKIPYNKFIDKTNIFLNARIVKDVDVLNETEINENS